MFTTNENKINNILAGITGSLICEISCGDITNVKSFRKELKDLDCFKVYDSVFGTFYNKYLKSYDNLESITQYLEGINNVTNYNTIQHELGSHNITCYGYTEKGRTITIHNNIAQLVIDCTEPTGPQIESFLNIYA